MPYDELRAAAEKATNGPWGKWSNNNESWEILAPYEGSPIAEPISPLSADDADFICLARRDIIPLLDENDRLRARMEELEAENAELNSDLEQAIENQDAG